MKGVGDHGENKVTLKEGAITCLTLRLLQGTLYPSDVGRQAMTVELNTERIYTELSWLRQEVQTLRSKLDALTPARPPSLRTDHPHIVRSEGVHGGRPIIRGTGVSVQTIVEQTRLGRAPAQIVEDYDGVAHPGTSARRG